LGDRRDISWETKCEGFHQIAIPKLVLAKYDVGSTVILGMPEEYHAKMLPSSHSVQGLDEWSDAETSMIDPDM
jgi:hypothetical protein